MNKRQNIVVLGGSFLQKEFAKTAKENGHNIFILDGNSNCFLSNNTDYSFHHLNFSKEDKVLKFCKENNIDLIYAPSNEHGNLIASRLADKIGYNFNSEEVVSNSLDKVKQRELFNELNYIKAPKSIVYKDNIELIDDSFTYPLIVKPSNSSASRGVTAANNKSELKTAIEYAKKHLNNSGDVIIEEYIDGEQISVETISANGKHYIAGITQEIVSGPPYFIERSHLMGKEIHGKYFDLLVSPIKELLTTANIKVGPCHIELKVKNNEIYLIELASRAGGWRDYLMKISGYPDYNQLIIDAYLKNNINEYVIQPPSQNGLVNIMTKVEDLHSFVEGRKDNILESYYFNGNGPVPKPQNLIDAYGYAYFKSTKSLHKYTLK